MSEPTQDPALAGAISRIAKQYPAIGKHLGGFNIIAGQSTDGRMLETYPADERDNPMPGRPTIEVFKRDANDDELASLIASDLMSHHMTGRDQQGNPVDPTVRRVADEVYASRTPEQRARDDQVWQEERKHYADDFTQDQWFEHNRGPAYLRGYVEKQWPDEVFTPEQRQKLEALREYLRSDPDFEAGYRGEQ